MDGNFNIGSANTKDNGCPRSYSIVFDNGGFSISLSLFMRALERMRKLLGESLGDI